MIEEDEKLSLPFTVNFRSLSIGNIVKKKSFLNSITECFMKCKQLTFFSH